MATVPFVDLGRLHGPLRAELDDALGGVVDRGDFILGGAVAEFEEDFAAYIGGRRGGRGRLRYRCPSIATEALGIGPGDEVIVPAHTYIASALGPLRRGRHVPVFCDVDPDTGLIDLDSAAAVLSERTAAIVVVHLYGQAARWTGGGVRRPPRDRGDRGRRTGPRGSWRRGAGPAPSATSPRSASIRPRTSARSATAASSRRRTRSSPSVRRTAQPRPDRQG